MGVLYGYGITSPITVEAELNLGLIGGAYAREDSAGVQIENGKFRVTTLAGYGVYRLPVTDLVYAKGKIGLLYENVKRTSNLADGGKTARGFGIAGGIGAEAGAIAALDAHDGCLRWVRTYSSDVAHFSRAGHTPPVYDDGVLYAAPRDSNLLLAIHAESGLLLWQREWDDAIQFVLGVAGNTLIVQGRSLWGVSLASGEPAWPNRRVGHEDPEGFSFGRGAIIGDEIWWPNREEFIVVDAGTGKIRRRLAVRESLGLTGGHLTPFATSLAVSRGAQLTVLGSSR